MMMVMRRFLVCVVMTACAFIAALISTSFSLSFFCNNDLSSLTVMPPQIIPSHDSDSYSMTGFETNTSRSSKRGCDYTVGRWVKSDVKPLYSGDSCKNWLARVWACRLMPNRPNFDYENYRWQPDACDFPVFNSQEFLSRMRNKVLAFVGDSIGQQQYQSMMCMLTGGKDDVPVEDVGSRYGFVMPRGSIRPEGVAHRFLQSNTTVIFYWSASLCDIQPLNATNSDTHYAMHLDRPVMFLQKYIGIMDVLVLNTGHHWNRGKITANKWEMHVDGKMWEDRQVRSLVYVRNLSLAKIVAWLDGQIKRNNTRAQIYLRSLSPRHFFEGEWDSGGRCDKSHVPVEEKNVTSQVAIDPVGEGAVMGTRVHLLNITFISSFRDEAHISKYWPHQSGQDCLHWCLPGVPDVWNELLNAKLFFDGGEPFHNTV